MERSRERWAVLRGVGFGLETADWERPAPSPRQQRLDVLIGLGMAAAGAGSAVLAYSVGLTIGSVAPPLAEAIVWSAAIALPLTVRRRYPLSSLVAVAALFIGLQSRLVPEQQMSTICLFTALFTAGAWGRDRHATRVVRIAVVVVMFAWLAYALSATAWAAGDDSQAKGPIPAPTASMIYVTLLNVLYFAAAMAFGTMAWNQARQGALLVQRNAELAVERDANAQRAVVAERLRIARELHDVVAHHVSLMGIQAAAARRVLDHDPALSRSTLEGVEESGRVAVDEMHRLLGVLRSTDTTADERMPAPGLDQLGELVQRTAQLGLPTELTVVGEPSVVPASVSVSAYRIVQEALTNTVRHAAASRVDVRLRYLAGAVEVEVVDDGRGAALAGSQHNRNQPSGNQHSGMGHVGMRERVAVHGGELELGPRPDGGYRVRARFPIAARAGVPAGANGSPT